MAKKFHVGQLCMLKNCYRPSNNGKVVTLRECLGMLEMSAPMGATMNEIQWAVEEKHLRAWDNSVNCCVAESQLIPINPDTDGTDDESHAYLPCVPNKQKEDAHV